MKSLIQSLPKELVAFFGFMLSFVSTYLIIPVIIRVVREKKLMDMPNQRSSHYSYTPTMGGIAFYISFVLLLFYVSFFHYNSDISIGISAGLMLLFFVGLKDDLIALSPRVKFSAQMLAAIFLLVNTNLIPLSFNGFLGISEFPYIIGFVFGCFVVLSIVNSFNLIDGINGSASMVGIVIFLSFSYLFYQEKDYYYATLSFSSAGFLFAFLRYNLSNRNCIFMGDTGSLVVGFIISFFVLRFLALPESSLRSMNIEPSNKIVMSLAILFIPFFDTLRVFTIRLLKDLKPFKPDRNHIHHIMIDYMNLSHTKASLLLAGINLFVFLMIYISGQYLLLIGVLSVFVGFMVLFSVLLFYFNRSYRIRKKKKVIRDMINKGKEL